MALIKFFPHPPDNLSMSATTPKPEMSPSNTTQVETGVQNTQDDQNVLKKLAEIELLPELFALLQRVETGEIKGQDFDNHAGPLRLKLNSIRSYLQEIDGICETVEERTKKIETLNDCNDRRSAFLTSFKQRVLTDLSEK